MRRALFLALAAVAALGLFGGERKLTEGYAPTYSPDGRRLAFERDVGETRRIGILKLDTMEESFPDLGPNSCCHPAFAPNGELYYVCQTLTNTQYEIAKTVRPTTGYNVFRLGKDGPQAVTTGCCHDMTPSVTPDGRWLYFASDRNDKRRMNNSIFRLDLADPAARPEKTIPGDMNYCSGVTGPVFSPDGRKVAWGEYGGWTPPYRVLLADVSAFVTNGVRVTDSPDFAFAPRFHPSGRYLTYTATTRNEKWGVRVVDLVTRATVRLADGRESAFSPDGRRLAYERGGVVYERDFDPKEVSK